MTIFDYIKSITTTKVALPLEEYVPFLINRWLSFISPSASSAVNETVNILGNVDKNTHYKLLLALFPKSKVPFIKYIKKVKKEKTEESEDLKRFASNMEISEREVKLLLELKAHLA